MKKVLAAVAAFAAATGIAGAQQDGISNPRGMVTNFDVDSIGPILTEMGAVWQIRQAPDGRQYIAVNAAGELTLNIVPMACQGENFTNCIGMNTMAFFMGGALNYQTVVAFNQKYAFSTAGISEEREDAYLSRYDISDYGIPRGNIAQSLLNFVVVAQRFRDELRTSAQTVSHEGYAEDMSARLLNSRGFTAMAGHDAVSALTRHEMAMEESSELVEVLLSDTDAPRNKIDNITAKK